jgi:hypothetical protein
MPTVKTFNASEIKQLIKDCDPRLRQYIEARERVLKMSQETIALAVKKIKELSIK